MAQRAAMIAQAFLAGGSSGLCAPGSVVKLTELDGKTAVTDVYASATSTSALSASAITLDANSNFQQGPASAPAAYFLATARQVLGQVGSGPIVTLDAFIHAPLPGDIGAAVPPTDAGSWTANSNYATAGIRAQSSGRFWQSLLPSGPANGGAVQPPTVPGSTSVWLDMGPVNLVPVTLDVTKAVASTANVFRDNFADTNGTALASHTAGGVTWRQDAGSFIIQNNTLTTSGPTDGVLASFDTGLNAYTYTLNGTIFGSPPSTLSDFSMILREIDANNFFSAELAPHQGTLTIYRRTAGTFNLLAQVTSAAITNGASLTLRADVYGPEITFWLNGVELFTITDTQGIGNTRVGIRTGANASPSGTAFLTYAQVQAYQGLRLNWPRTTRLAGTAGNPVVALGAATSAAGSLTTALTSGTTYTSLPVTLTKAVNVGDFVDLVSGSNFQSFIVTAAAASGSTSVAVQSQAATFAFPTSSTVNSGGYDNTDANNPNVTFDPVNSRWVLDYSGYHDNGSHNNVQNMCVAYSTTGPQGPYTKDPLNPVFLANSTDGGGAMNGGIAFLNGLWCYAYCSNNGSVIRFATSPDLHTWTRVGLIPTGGTGTWDAGGAFDPFLRVRQDGVTLELTYGGSATANGARSIGMATSTDGGNTWVKDPASPFLVNPGNSTGISFSEPSVFVPPGKEGQQKIVSYDAASPALTNNRYIGQAITLDGGVTWHHRQAQRPLPGSTFDSAGVFDSFMLVDGGKFYLFHSGATSPGLVLNLGSQIIEESVVWNSANLALA